MPRKPSVSGDGNIWGQVLNDYLDVAHNLDGTLKTALITGPQGPQGVAGPQGPQGPAGPSGGGSATLAVATKTAAYALTTADRVVLADTTSGAFTLTLPAPSGAAGIPFQIKQKAGANTLTVAPTTGTIDGAGTLIFTGANAAYTFISDGSNYYVF